MTLIKGLVAGPIVAAVAEIGPKYPRFGGLLLTLPLVSVLAFIMAWNKIADLPAISTLAKESLIVVPLGLPFFNPLAFAGRLGLGFWLAMGIGIDLATASIGLYFWLAAILV